MEQSCKRTWPSLLMEGSAAAYIEAFTELLHEQGYTQSSVHQQTRLVADFSRWLMRRGITATGIARGHADRYIRYRGRHQHLRRGDAAALKRLLDLLCRKGVIPPQEAPIERTPVQQLLDEFASYLRQDRMLASTTLAYYLPFVRCFLTERFGRARPRLSRLRAADVVEFVQRQAARLIRKRAQVMTTALRSFLHYALYRGYINADLAAAVPTVANWSMSEIPRSIAPEHVRRVLASCNRETGVGRRDYAILLLLSRLGLRASEIAFLRLEDIDWTAGCVNVCGKGGRRSSLPLPVEVGEAIAAYVKLGRPDSRSRLRVGAGRKTRWHMSPRLPCVR